MLRLSTVDNIQVMTFVCIINNLTVLFVAHYYI